MRDLSKLLVDELWSLHEQVRAELSSKSTLKKIS